MPDFVDPFSGNVDKELNTRELIRALRLDIAAEEEAINLYEAHADATDNPIVKKVLQDVANEEREHVGEFQALLNMLAPNELEFLQSGEEEVTEMKEEVAKRARAKFVKTMMKINQNSSIFASEKLAQGRGFNSPWTVLPVTQEDDGLTDAQMSVIVAKYNALSEFMAHMLGADPSGLILPGAEAKQETQRERDARNARRRELKERLRKKVLREESKEGGLFEGGFVEDKYGRPLTGNEQEAKKQAFKDFFNDYLDAGIRLVLWQSKNWDPAGNITLYTAEGITHDTVKAEVQAQREQEREERAREFLGEEEDVSSEDVYQRSYEGTPLQTPEGPIKVGDTPENPKKIELSEIDETNVNDYMKRAKNIFEKANDDLKRITQEYKFQSPEKIEALQKVATEALVAQSIYEAIVNRGFESMIERIAQGQLEKVKELLILIGYPEIMRR
jgi:uncharacterized protein